MPALCADVKATTWCATRIKYCHSANASTSNFIRVRCNATCGCAPILGGKAATELLWEAGLRGSTIDATLMAATLPRCALIDGMPWQQRALAAIQHGGHAGTALVIGANTGATNLNNDPFFRMLNSSDAAHIRKVFVEPIPAFFRALEVNLRTMPNAVAVHAAIHDFSEDGSDGTGSDQRGGVHEAFHEVRMFCLVEPDTGSVPSLGNFTGASKPKRWWAQICSLDRERLFSFADVQRDYYLRSGGSHNKDVRERLEGFVRNVSVPALTVGQLLRRHAPHASPVRYVQLDVEGWDDHLLGSLPFGRSSGGGGGPVFSPDVVVFEWNVIGFERFTRAIRMLQGFNYRACWDDQNVVGLRDLAGHPRRLLSKGSDQNIGS